MLKRHEVEILLKAGHSKAEAGRLAGVSLRSVNRIAEEAPVVHVDDADEREKRRIGRPSIVEDFRKPWSRFWKNNPTCPLWRSFAGFGKQATREARPPCTRWWLLFVRKR